MADYTMRGVMMSEFQTTSIANAGYLLLQGGERVDVPTWQALDVRNSPRGKTFEAMGTTVIYEIPPTTLLLQEQVKPNLPWAENHFQERVSGKPLNPGETYKEWPWYRGNVEQHKETGKFSHTYMERYWCRSGNHLGRDGKSYAGNYGDLNDVVNLLATEPTTRQAYLPVWFPLDTGVVHRERVPCSLGYQFLLRKKELHIIYGIRSCDFYRHFKDDVYLTARLCQWVLEEIQDRCELADEKAIWLSATPGTLMMNIGSLHVFEGDLPRLRREYGDG